MSSPIVAHIEKSIITILNDDHQIIGYGFFVDPHGTAITCYHVIAALPTIRIRDHDGNEFIAAMDEYHTRYGAKESDIAILRIPTQTPIFLQLPLTKYVENEMTVIKVNGSNLEPEDILYHNVSTPTHPPSSHGLPITTTGTTMAVGFLSVANYRSLPSLAIFRATPKSAQLELLFQYLSDKYCPGESDPQYSELKTVCNLQVQRAVRNLTEQKVILPDNFCNEPRFGNMVSAFKDHPESILTLLGESGSGKTSCLVRELPDFTRKFFTLFISAQDFEPLPASLPGKIKNVLTQTLAAHPYEGVTADDIMNLIYQHPEKCMIIIDGLNQMPRISSKTFDDWFTRSIRWARGMGLKLIITSTVTPTYHNPFQLDGFTEERIKLAVTGYHLPEKFSKVSRLNHPLLLRLLHDLGSQELSAPLDDYPLLTTWLARKCTAIATRTQVSSQIIHTRLIDIAKHFIASNDYWLSNDTYHHILKDAPHLSSMLIQENLFIQSVNGIRIAHNWLADFLIGETFHTDAGIDWEELIPVSTSTQRKGLPWFLAKKSFLGQDISPLLQNLITFILKNDRHQPHATKIFTNTVRRLSHPDKYYAIIESFTIQALKRSIPGVKVGPIVYNSHLSFPNQFKLIKIALSSEKPHPMDIISYLGTYFSERKKYLQQPPLVSTKQTVERYLRTDHKKVIAQISEWLYDYSDQDEIPMINIIAGIIIYQNNKKFKIPFNPWVKETPAQASILKLMISLILTAQDSLMEPVHYELIQQRGSIKDLLNDTDAYLKSLPPIVLSTFHRLPADENKIIFTMWLLRIPEYRKEMIREILILFKEGNAPEWLSRDLRAYVTQEGIFEMLVPMLVKYIKYGKNYNVRKQLIPILFQFGKNKEQNRILAEHLAALIRGGSDFDTHFTRCLVRGLYILPTSSAAFQILSEMIPILLERNMQSWYHTLIYLCREEKNEHKRADKIKWIQWAFNNLPERQLCALVILILNMKIIQDEDKIREMIKPTLLLTLKESNQFYYAVLQKAAKKNTALFYDLVNDEDLKVLDKV